MFSEVSRYVNKFYLANFSLVFAVILTICATFFVQFKVEAAHDKIAEIKNQISAAHDDIQLLEVQWVYLTRPGRLRDLSAKYLKDNGYALASQIKDQEKLEDFYYANYEKYNSDELAVNSNISKSSL